MNLRFKYLLSAAGLGALLLLIIGAARFQQPRAGAVAPAPLLAAIRPGSISAGSPGLTLTVVGSFFVKKSVVQWNGEARATSFVDETILRARIPPSDVAAEGTASVSVSNQALPSENPGVSNVLGFRIGPPGSH